MILLFLITGILIIAIYTFIQQPSFGKIPSDERFEIIKNSPHYKNGAFHNLSYTPIMIKGTNLFKVISDFLVGKGKRNKPTDAIPTVRTDLLNLDLEKNILIWFGHSSYFIQIDGKTILVDPVFSGHASPFPFSIRAFKGSDAYSASDIPEIDYLFITHDHWDHLDYKTIINLKLKIKKIICPLGVGAHFEHWGFDKKQIIEKDWYEKIVLDKDFIAHTVPTRHFSGRTFVRNKSLWTAFVLQCPSMQIFMGGDGGYDTHFKEIASKFGAFDLVILENGQYNKTWKYIHSSPEEVWLAAIDLQAKRLLPVHSCKFALALHDWDEPLKRITELSKEKNIQLLTPMIGEAVNLKDEQLHFQQWWKTIN
ncbi:MAG: MBL fold metallo-hydrolase [Bacteroidetes bacterium]|nr:MBL fold metallo-hydrolase [Bacteroidota bacterium]